MSHLLRSDGSARTDAQKPVRIEADNPAHRWRFTCPNGHRNWDRTNSHLWCIGCSRANDAGNDIDPEHYELVDQKTGETIAWSRVRLVYEGE